MSSKIITPFTGPITANALKIWLGRCEDGFENYQDTHKDATLSAKTRIRLTGAALQEASMAEWWSAGRTEYLGLLSWDAFVKKLKARFLPVGWKMDVLEKFYACEQGRRDFQTYVAELAQCYGALPANTISSTVYKYHLLFHSHPQLYLRIRALPDFDVDSSAQTVDTLAALMGHQWDSLVADVAPRGTRLPTSTTVPLKVTSSTTSTSPRPTSGPGPLSEADKKVLQDANGCFNCRLKPGDPDWVSHFRRNCPGNTAIGALPGPEYVAPGPTTAGGSSGLVAVALQVPRDDDTSEDEDGDDGESDSDSWP